MNEIINAYELATNSPKPQMYIISYEEHCLWNEGMKLTRFQNRANEI